MSAHRPVCKDCGNTWPCPFVPASETPGPGEGDLRGEDDKEAFLASLESPDTQLRHENERLVKMIADFVQKATDYGEQDGGFVAFYLLPTGPIHRAIPLLAEYGVHVRPGIEAAHDAAVEQRTLAEQKVEALRADMRRSHADYVTVNLPRPVWDLLATLADPTHRAALADPEADLQGTEVCAICAGSGRVESVRAAAEAEFDLDASIRAGVPVPVDPEADRGGIPEMRCGKLAGHVGHVIYRPGDREYWCNGNPRPDPEADRGGTTTKRPPPPPPPYQPGNYSGRVE